MVIISTSADEVIIQAVSPEFSGSLVAAIGATRGHCKRAETGKRCKPRFLQTFHILIFQSPC